MSGAQTLELLLQAATARTPARLFDAGGPGSYSTARSLDLRADHAAARDAVGSRLDVGLFDGALALRTCATDRRAYLRDPELGRQLCAPSRAALAGRASVDSEVQIIVGDGLSAAAVHQQAPVVIEGLRHEARVRGWRLAPLLVVEQCRVGVLNDIGELTGVGLCILLVGERPGLATAESMSAYLAWRPSRVSTDADRNLISNIHERGVPAGQAAVRIADLAEVIMSRALSGFMVKESLRPERSLADRSPGPSALPVTP